MLYSPLSVWRKLELYLHIVYKRPDLNYITHLGDNYSDLGERVLTVHLFDSKNPLAGTSRGFVVQQIGK